MTKKEAVHFHYNLEEYFRDWRYRVQLKKLGLPEIKKRFKKKFILIQIDALPYNVLEELFNTPDLKFLRSLITDKHFFVSRYNCGLPSDTPTATAGICYGASEEVAGFRTIDKKNKKILSFADPNTSEEMEKRIKKRGNPGILKDGSASVLMYSGDAARTFLTMSTFKSKRSLKRLKESNIIVLLLLNPLLILKVTWNSTIELILELYDSIHAFIHRTFIVKEKKARFRLVFPFKRFFYQGLIMELQRIAAILDMKRGVPRIYLNFHAYDDIAHRRGTKSNASRRVLRQIDRTIKNLYNNTPVDYDLYVMSDHGIEDSVPFDVRYDETLAQLLQRLTKVETQESEADEGWNERLKFGAKRMGQGLHYLTGPFRWTLNMILKVSSKNFREQEKESIWKDKEQIFIRNGCGLAHIYFNISRDRMDISDIDKNYPKLIEKLRKHPGIGVLVVKSKDKIKILGWDGEFTVQSKRVNGKTKITSRKGSDFLKRYGKTDVLLEQIRSLAIRRNVGDLIIFGGYHHNKIISFGEYYAAHGGIGQQMCSPFFMSKQGFDLTDAISSDEIYKIFKEYL